MLKKRERDRYGVLESMDVCQITSAIDVSGDVLDVSDVVGEPIWLRSLCDNMADYVTIEDAIEIELGEVTEDTWGS